MGSLPDRVLEKLMHQMQASCPSTYCSSVPPDIGTKERDGRDGEKVCSRLSSLPTEHFPQEKASSSGKHSRGWEKGSKSPDNSTGVEGTRGEIAMGKSSGSDQQRAVLRGQQGHVRVMPPKRLFLQDVPGPLLKVS